jgi:osmotically-inducible protein OsmY
VLSGSNIDVDVKDGVVTLQARSRAKGPRPRHRGSKKTDGVKNVVDQLDCAGAP